MFFVYVGGFCASNNQFQINGIKGYSERKILPNNQLFFRIDLPSVSKQAIHYLISPDKKMVIFAGEALQESPYEESSRTFFSAVGVNCHCCELAGCQSVIDGVLRMVLQKVSVKCRCYQETLPCPDGFCFMLL